MGLRDLTCLLRWMSATRNEKVASVAMPVDDRPWVTFVTRPGINGGSSRSRLGCTSRIATLREYEELPPLWLCDDHAKVVEARTPRV